MSPRDRLLEMICRRAYTAGTVTLASGQVSDFYVDLRRVVLSPEGAFLSGELLYRELESLVLEHDPPLQVDGFGGLAVGAVPLTASLADACWRNGMSHVEGFFVRPEAKDHGRRNLIEGALQPRSRVAVLEDVATTGGSAQRAVDALREAGHEVVGVLALVDREAGARERFERVDIPFRAVFSRRDVVRQAILR